MSKYQITVRLHGGFYEVRILDLKHFYFIGNKKTASLIKSLIEKALGDRERDK